MRIVTGDYKRKQLKIPKTKMVRPTRAMVRKAIVDILGDFVMGKDILDLFSGSGALGFEALSCRARSVTFVDHKHLCQKIIRENASILKVADKCTILAKDVFAVLAILQKKGLKFQIVFADPPYYAHLAKKCLLEISKCDILLPPAMVVIEHYKKDELPDGCKTLARWQLKKYGDTFVSFYTPV